LRPHLPTQGVNVVTHSQFRLFDASLPFIGRLLIAAIFLISGAGKIAMPAATIGAIASVGLPFPQLGLVIVVFVELAGGIALILGYRARLAAAMLAAFCIATAVLFHSNVADQNQLVHFLKNIAMTGGLLQVVAFGAGRFGLDARTPPLPAAAL
jgi:putative oxidoreductase